MAKIDVTEIDRIASGCEPESHALATAFGNEACSSELTDPWRLLQVAFSLHFRPEDAKEPLRPPPTFDEANMTIFREIFRRQQEFRGACAPG